MSTEFYIYVVLFRLLMFANVAFFIKRDMRFVEKYAFRMYY